MVKKKFAFQYLDSDYQKFKKRMRFLLGYKAFPDPEYVPQEGDEDITFKNIFLAGQPFVQFIDEGGYWSIVCNGDDGLSPVYKTFIKIENGSINLDGFKPLFVLESNLCDVKAGKRDRVKLFTFDRFYLKVIEDRILQWMGNTKDRAAIDALLQHQNIPITDARLLKRYQEVLAFRSLPPVDKYPVKLQAFWKNVRHSELHKDLTTMVSRYVDTAMPNVPNAQVRIRSKLVLLRGLRKPEQSSDQKDKPWAFSADTNTQKRAFGDMFRKQNMPKKEQTRIMKDFFNIEPYSDQSGQKGIWVCLEPEIQKMRGNKNMDAFCDIGYEVISEGDNRFTLTIFADPDKMVQCNTRNKAFVCADSELGYIDPSSDQHPAVRYEGYEDSEDLKDIVFERWKNYLVPQPGMENLQDRTAPNLLVAFVGFNPTLRSYIDNNGYPHNSKEFKEFIDPKKFFESDKRIFNQSLVGLDGHVSISQNVCEILFRRKRTFKTDLTFKNFVPEFQQLMNDLSQPENERPTRFWPPVEVEEGKAQRKASEVAVGYYHVCDTCGSIMAPTQGEAQTAMVWHCTMEDPEAEDPILMDKPSKPRYMKYKGTVKVLKSKEFDAELARDMEEDSRPETTGADEDLDSIPTISIQVEVIEGPNGCRIVTSDGAAKAIVVGYSQDHIGWVEVEGRLVALDAHIPPPSDKGKEYSMVLAAKRLQMALQKKILPINPLLRDMTTANETFDPSTRTKHKISYKKFNVQKNAFEMVQEEAYIGLIQMKLTEAASEFVKTTDSEAKISFQVLSGLYQLGKQELANAMLAASFTHNAPVFNEDGVQINHSIITEQTAFELTKIFMGVADDLPEFNLVDIIAMHKSSNFIVNSYVTVKRWLEVRTTHFMFTNKQFEKGFILRIPVRDEAGILSSIVFRIPSPDLMVKSTCPGGSSEVWIPQHVTAVFKLLYAIAFNSKIKPDNSGSYSEREAVYHIHEHYRKYRAAIGGQIIGKWGILARLATLRGFVTGGKEWGSAYIPPGVAVINDRDEWKKIVRKAVKAGLGSVEDIMSGRVKIFGYSIRDPEVWPLQSACVVQLWSIGIANRFFKAPSKDDPKRANYCQLRKDGVIDPTPVLYASNRPDVEALHRNPVGITLSILDMAYLFQSDSDGDFRRIFVQYDEKVQRLSQEFHTQMNNYDYINPDKLTEKDPQFLTVNADWEWHLEYLFGESKDKHAVDLMKFPWLVRKIIQSEVNHYQTRSVEKKGDISSTTVSLWQLTTLVRLLIADGKISLVEGTNVVSFYGKHPLQGTCIRGLKNKAISATTLGMVCWSKNVELDYEIQEPNSLGEKLKCIEVENIWYANVRDYLFYCYPEDRQAVINFFEVCDLFMGYKGLMKDPEKDTWVEDPHGSDQMSVIVSALTNFSYGSQSNGLVGDEGIDLEILERQLLALASPEIDKIPIYKEAFKFIIPLIRSIVNKDKTIVLPKLVEPKLIKMEKNVSGIKTQLGIQLQAHLEQNPIVEPDSKPKSEDNYTESDCAGLARDSKK